MPSTINRATIIALVASTLVLASAVPASAHYQIDDRRWWFGGSTYGESGSRAKIDPVNLLLYPGWATKSITDDHFNAHIGTPGREPNEWIEDGSLPASLRCKGDQFVKFRKIGPSSDPWEYVDTDFHGAMVERSAGRCFNRYHVRFWGDATHESLSNTDHPSSKEWIAAGAHYEEVWTDDGVGHTPQLDWDLVEQRTIQFMRPHSYSHRWKCLPNSFGLYQTYRNDGRISRISVNHGRGDSTRATRENGQC